MENSYTVYKHISPTGKIYIGITSSNPKLRWSNGKGYIGNEYFTNAIQKYGWKNFKHEILFENLSKEEACKKEIELIVEYKSNNREFGYNICAGGEGTNGYHHTEETKKKLSLYSHNITDEQRKQISDTVKQLWELGVYDNMSIAHKGQKAWNKGLTKDDPRVAKYCRKVGTYKPSEKTKKLMSLSHKGKPAINRRKIICIETNEIFNSISEASKLKNINNIGKALKDNKYTAGSYHWKYYEEE